MGPDSCILYKLSGHDATAVVMDHTCNKDQRDTTGQRWAGCSPNSILISPRIGPFTLKTQRLALVNALRDIGSH